MAFPKLENKHTFESLINPEDFTKYKKWNKKEFPKKIIITYQRSPLAYFKRKYKGKYKVLNLSKTYKLFVYKDIGYIRIPGIGAPNAVTTFEELIAMGAKEFINLGSAGGLVDNGIFLCNKSVRDEGTSHHYIEDTVYSYADEALTKKLGKTLKESNFKFTIGSSWTIDAPYRETKKEVEHYRKQGILTVEMESSALFAVAKLRKVKIASMFVVSDVLANEKWDPQFHKFDFIKTLNQLVDVAINCLEKK